MQTLPTTVKTKKDIREILRPFHDRILVERDDAPKFTKSGLEIPGTSVTFRPHTGKVLGIGGRCMDAKERMHIMFGRASGTEITINDKKFLLMREADVVLDMDTLKPFYDRVLVTPDPLPKMIKGIHVPDTVMDQPQSGTVVSVGSAVTEVLSGQRVLLGKFAGFRFTLKDKEKMVIREADIFAKLD
jgi:chaperonin GroES